MPQQVQLKIAGLHSSPNEFSEVPPGALAVADNVVINQNSVIEPRRGFDRITAALPGSPKYMWFYQDKLFAHTSDNTISYYNAGSWVLKSGSFIPPVKTTSPLTYWSMRAALGNQNLYLTTSSGVKKFDAFTGNSTAAGAPKGLDITTTVLGSTGAVLQVSQQCAYRVVWGIKDANSNLVIGAPSGRATLINATANPVNATIVVNIPTSITTAWFCQLYRSSAVSSATGEPSDEMGLVYEVNPTAGDITAGFLTITDIVVDTLRGATLYTSASQQGLAYGNEQPPLCTDIAVFKDTTFFASTTTKYGLNVSLLTSSGISVGDTVTVGGQLYTAKAIETVASREFGISTATSESQKIRETSQSLIRCVNRDTSNLVYGFYQSGPTDLPGQLRFEARTLGAAVFTFTSSKVTLWSPTGLPLSATNDNFQNGISYSKTNQPEAVPLPNTFVVGQKNKAILRIIPLRDSLFVFKEDGIFRITDSGNGGFQVNIFDTSARLVAPESCAVLSNQIYCLTDQGVCSITETGVSVISRPIELEILACFSYTLDLVKSISFGVGYESERKYILFLPSSSVDVAPSQAFVWNTFTQAWTRWTLTKTCAVVGTLDVNVTPNVSKNVLYLGENATYVDVERKSLTYTDYADFSFITSLSAVAGTSVTVSSGADNIRVGDILYQSATVFATVTTVNSITGVVTVDLNPTFTVAAVTVLAAINTSIQWLPAAGEGPSTVKHFQEAVWIFRTDFSGTATASFSTDLSLATTNISLTGRSPALWGLFIWSDTAIWGGVNARRPCRIWVPRGKQVGSYLNVGFAHRSAFSGWQLEGVAITLEANGSERVRR